MTEGPSRNEDEYFAKLDAELIKERAFDGGVKRFTSSMFRRHP